MGFDKTLTLKACEATPNGPRRNLRHINLHTLPGTARVSAEVADDSLLYLVQVAPSPRHPDARRGCTLYAVDRPAKGSIL